MNGDRSDGGGVVPAVLSPVVGADNVGRFPADVLGRIATGPYAVRNPEKLSYLEQETALSR